MHYSESDRSIKITGTFKRIYQVVHYQENLNLNQSKKAKVRYLRVWARVISASFLTSCLSSRSWECDSIFLSSKLLSYEAEVLRDFLRVIAYEMMVHTQCGAPGPRQHSISGSNRY